MAGSGSEFRAGVDVGIGLTAKFDEGVAGGVRSVAKLGSGPAIFGFTDAGCGAGTCSCDVLSAGRASAILVGSGAGLLMTVVGADGGSIAA
jgi:hypothetical protein